MFTTFGKELLSLMVMVMMFWILETQTTNKQVSLLFLFGQVSTHTTSVTTVSQYIWTFPSPLMSLEKEQTMNDNSCRLHA